MAEINIRGLPELQKVLDTLPAKVERNVLRQALREGAKVLHAEAAYRAPSKSAELVSSLRIGTRVKGGTVTSYVKTDDWKARFVEYGTKPHFISVPDAEKPINWRLSAKRMKVVRASMTTVNRAIRSLKIGNTFVGPTVHHPGIAPYNVKSVIGPHAFMRPALDAGARGAVIAVAAYIKKLLETKHGIDTSHIMIEGDE